MADVDVRYQVYTAGRWLPDVVNTNDYAGSSCDTAIQRVYANLSRGSVQYRVRTLNGSWLPWVTDRQDYAGSSSGVGIDELQMRVTGLSGYTIRYRAYTGGRWLAWVDGTDTNEYAGLPGQAITRIQMEVVPISISNAELLSYASNHGLFSGCGVSFTSFNVEKDIAIISLKPIITVKGSLSLSHTLYGGKYVNLSAGQNSLGLSIYNDAKSLGVNLGANFSPQSLASTLKPLTLSTSINELVYTVGFEGINLVIKVQAKNTFLNHTVYQIMTFTIHNMINSSFVTIPVATTTSSSDFNISIDPKYAAIAICTILGIGILISTGAITAVAAAAIVVNGTTLAQAY